jgi:hypothetical protein
LHYDQAMGRFVFDVEAQYVRNALTLVDVAPFDGVLDSVRDASTCGNLPASSELTDPMAPFD